MSSTADNYEQRVLEMVGVRLSNGVKDYGVIVDYLVITHNLSRRYVFVTDKDRRIDAGSAMRFMRAYRRSLQDNPLAIVYPDGSDTVMRRRAMRVRRSGGHSITSGYMPNVANVGDNERINISSTATSAGAFPEEYRDGYPNQ